MRSSGVAERGAGLKGAVDREVVMGEVVMGEVVMGEVARRVPTMRRGRATMEIGLPPSVEWT